MPLPDTLREEIGTRLAPLRSAFRSARWVHPSSLHLTLAFVGDTDPGDLPRIVDAMRGAVRDRPAFEARLATAGKFGSGRRRPLVAWLGLGSGGRELVELMRDLHERLGTPPDERGRRDDVHLTVAREATPELIGGLREAVQPPLAAWVVDRTCLYRSHLGSGPPRYEELDSVALAPAIREC